MVRSWGLWKWWRGEVGSGKGGDVGGERLGQLVVYGDCGELGLAFGLKNLRDCFG